jgi:Fe2+ or Zn2+ uptake regulation protein
VLDVQELTESIRVAGGRVTPQRVAVIEAIGQSTSHPTVDQLFEKVSISQPSLSRKTVYQIVNDLAGIGAIALVDVGTGQLRIDPTVEHTHDHFVCSKCKCIFDIERKKLPTVSSSARKFGDVESIDVVYRGICKNCSKRT